MEKFSSIDALRHVVVNVRRYFDARSQRYPTIKFKGTVKLHGSNGGVHVKNGDVRPQSRENLLSMQSDNAGFYAFCHPRFDVFREMAQKVGHDDITIFGEWCGGNIQKSVALNQLPKHFVIFNVWNSKAGDSGGYIGLDALQYTDTELKSLNDQGIWFINQIPDYEIDIDFNDPQKAADIITEMTLKVENECPWAYFRINRVLSDGVTVIGNTIIFNNQPIVLPISVKNAIIEYVKSNNLYNKKIIMQLS